MIAIDDCEMLCACLLCIPDDDEKAAFFKDALAILRGRQNITNDDMREAISGASRLLERRRGQAA